MTLTSRLRAIAVTAVVVLTAAVPALASSTSSHGNRCGAGHAKHTRAIGKTCVKHNASSRAAAVAAQAKQENESADTEGSEDRAGTTDQADLNENDQGDVNDNEQGDVNDDQGDANDIDD